MRGKMKSSYPMKTGYVLPDDVVLDAYGNMTDEKLTGLQAIKHFCVECQGGHYFPWRDNEGKIIPRSLAHSEVKNCTSTKCYLHPYRMGRRPK